MKYKLHNPSYEGSCEEMPLVGEWSEDELPKLFKVIHSLGEFLHVDSHNKIEIMLDLNEPT